MGFNATPKAPVMATVVAAHPRAADTAVYHMEVHRDSSELGGATLIYDCNREKILGVELRCWRDRAASEAKFCNN